MERYLGVNLLGPGPRLMKKRIYRAAVSQRLRNTGLDLERTEAFRHISISLSRSDISGRCVLDFRDW